MTTRMSENKIEFDLKSGHADHLVHDHGSTNSCSTWPIREAVPDG